jgi:hypothetical protein
MMATFELLGVHQRDRADLRLAEGCSNSTRSPAL